MPLNKDQPSPQASQPQTSKIFSYRCTSCKVQTFATQNPGVCPNCGRIGYMEEIITNSLTQDMDLRK